MLSTSYNNVYHHIMHDSHIRTYRLWLFETKVSAETMKRSAEYHEWHKSLTGGQDVTKFVVGQTYSDRSACDHDCIFNFTVVARTAKQLTLAHGGKTFRRGIFIWDNVEACKPFGTYSMCTIIRATDKDLSNVPPGPGV